MREPASRPEGTLRFAIRVRPGAARNEVGGRYGDALVVRVRAAAERGRATEAALRAVAEALGLRRRDIRLVSGMTARDKIVEVEGNVAEVRSLLDHLQGSGER